MCFGRSKEPSHRDGSLKYLQHMFWLRNKKNNFLLCTLIWGPELYVESQAYAISTKSCKLVQVYLNHLACSSSMHAGYLSCFCCHLLTFFKINFFKKNLSGTLSSGQRLRWCNLFVKGAFQGQPIR